MDRTVKDGVEKGWQWYESNLTNTKARPEIHTESGSLKQDQKYIGGGGIRSLAGRTCSVGEPKIHTKCNPNYTIDTQKRRCSFKKNRDVVS